MGLTDVLARLATRSAHVLPVEVPGHWQTRAALERAVLSRGWRLAVSPADADVLAVCGSPGPRLSTAIDLVWQQLPGPRVRIELWPDDDPAVRLDEARAGLMDGARQRSDASARPSGPDLLAAETDSGHAGHGGDGGHGGHEGHGDHDHMDHDGMDHGDEDHGDMDHGGHGGHEGHGDHGDHEGMEMAPGGVSLAQGGEDRDGLEMDVLHVRLGPVLAYWPPGLVLRCALQGDVVADARAEMLDADTAPLDGKGSARTVDHVASLLALAGWDDAADEARAVRDALLSHGRDDETSARLGRLRHRVEGSRVLRWSLRGLRPLARETRTRLGLPEHVAGDTYDRLLRMLDLAGDDDHICAAIPVDGLPDLVQGLDLATARLVVASLDPGNLRASRAPHHEISHG